MYSDLLVLVDLLLTLLANIPISIDPIAALLALASLLFGLLTARKSMHIESD